MIKLWKTKPDPIMEQFNAVLDKNRDELQKLLEKLRQIKWDTNGFERRFHDIPVEHNKRKSRA